MFQNFSFPVSAKAWVATALLFLTNFPYTEGTIEWVSNGAASMLAFLGEDAQKAVAAGLISLVGGFLVFLKRNRP